MKDVMQSIEDPRTLLLAIRALTVGGVAVLPTDTVYGFHCLAGQRAAIDRVASIKGGDGPARTYILLSDSVAKLGRWAEMEQSHQDILEANCPGPISFLLPAKSDLDPYLCSNVDGTARVAFRIPDHPFLRSLLELLEEPLVSTSVNPSGQAPLEFAADIGNLYGDQVDLIASDSELEDRIRLEGAKASTLVDLTRTPPEILRQGSVTPDFSMVASPG